MEGIRILKQNIHPCWSVSIILGSIGSYLTHGDAEDLRHEVGLLLRGGHRGGAPAGGVVVVWIPG